MAALISARRRRCDGRGCPSAAVLLVAGVYLETFTSKYGANGSASGSKIIGWSTRSCLRSTFSSSEVGTPRPHDLRLLLLCLGRLRRFSLGRWSQSLFSRSKGMRLRPHGLLAVLFPSPLLDFECSLQRRLLLWRRPFFGGDFFGGDDFRFGGGFRGCIFPVTTRSLRAVSPLSSSCASDIPNFSRCS